MIRRNFIQRLTMAGASSALATASSVSRQTVVFRVKGFSCITCAVGLDTILGQKAGVIRCHSTYPDGRTTLEFDPSKITEEALRGAISEMGFQAERETR